MSSTHPLLGIEFGEAKVRFARAGKKPFTLGLSHAIAVPKNAIVKGVVQDAQTLRSLVQEAAASLRHGGNECVLLVPTDIVHSYVFTLKSPSRSKVLKQLAEKLGEPARAFTVLTHRLAATETDHTVGVVAIRTEYLQEYVSICRKAGLKVRAVSTAPAVTLAAQPTKETANQILLYAPSVDEKSSISIVQYGWIADEVVMSAKRGFAKIFQTATSMIEEASKKKVAMTHMLVHASNDAITSAKKSFGASKKKTGKLIVTRALTIAEEDRVYAGALSASFIAIAQLPYNLLIQQKTPYKRLIALGLLLGGIIFAMIVMGH